MQWAQSYLNLHKEIEKDYTARYEKYKTVQNENGQHLVLSNHQETNASSVVDEIPIEETKLFKELKSYR